MAKETAEQKLLKLIEQTDSQEAAQGAAAPASGEAEAQKVLDSVMGKGDAALAVPPFLKNLFYLFKPAAGPGQPAGFGLREANMILAVTVLAAALFFFLDFRRGMSEARQELRFDVDMGAVAMNGAFIPQIRDMAEYVSVVARRNIFQPVERQVEESVAAEGGDPVANQLAEKGAKLKLVGISWLDSPGSATALIEDEATAITHFLKEGDEFKGFKILTIYADSVLLGAEGQTITKDL